MRFMTLWRPGPCANRPTDELQAEMGALIIEMRDKGVLLETGGWDPKRPSTLLRSSCGKVTVTEVSFSESRELIGGFALIEVTSKEEAIEWCKRFLTIAGEGSSELREIPEGARG